MTTKFKDRKAAGEQLAETLKTYAGQPVIVYALPRGGVVLGLEVAKALRAPLDLVIARKVGYPTFPEYAIAAVTERGDPIINEDEAANVDEAWLKEAIAFARAEAKRRREKYLTGMPSPSPADKTAIIVDDGLATGLTMKAAVKEIDRRHPKQIIVAVPVASKDTVATLSRLVDKVVVLYVPAEYFGAIGEYYEAFPQVTDDEVVALMHTAAQPKRHHEP